MGTSIKNYIVPTSTVEWQPLIEEGIDCTGLFWKPLRREDSGRPLTFFLRFEAGAKYPYHNHPAGEELMILDGSCIIEGTELQTGDYLYTPPGFKHSVRSESGCTIFFMVPQEVEIISEV